MPFASRIHYCLYRVAAVVAVFVVAVVAAVVVAAVVVAAGGGVADAVSTPRYEH